MKKLPRKRRTRAHVISDLSVNHTERQALLCGYTVERNFHDYGIDLEINTFNEIGEIEEGKILMQVKASEQLDARADGTFGCRVERKDLVHWLGHPMPVILILYDATNNAAYWRYVQGFYQKLASFNLFSAGKTITVPISSMHVLGPDAMMKFARFRDRTVGQMKEIVHDEDEDQDDSL